MIQKVLVFCSLLLVVVVFAHAQIRPKVQGERASIAVAKLSVKAPKYKEIDSEGANMHDMIITALFRTGRFVIYEREILKELEEEQKLGKGEAEYATADIMIAGAITAFEPHAAGRQIGGGGCLPIFGGFIGGAMGMEREEAYIAMDVRVVDTRTREVLGASRIEGRPAKEKYNFISAAWFPGIMAAGGLSKYENTPTEKAIYDMLDKLVGYLVGLIPPRYFTH